MKINKIRSKLNLLKKFAYKNNSTCVCVVCVLLSVALSLIKGPLEVPEKAAS